MDIKTHKFLLSKKKDENKRGDDEMTYTKDFTTSKEATAFAKEFEKNGITINYRITANYPLVLVGRKVKTDRLQSPVNYTLK